MKSPSLRRISALTALAVLFVRASHAESPAGLLPTGRVCPSIYMECMPGTRFNVHTCACVPESDEDTICPAFDCGRGLRMNRRTCRCMPDGPGDFRTYEKLGTELRDAVASPNQGSAAAMLSAHFDGLTAAAGEEAPAVAAYAAAPSVAGYTGGYSTRLSQHVEPDDVPSPDEIKRLLPPSDLGKPKLQHAIFSGATRSNIMLVSDSDANPKSSDNAIVGATAGAIAGSAGGVAGAATGMVAGALAGAHQDQQEKARKDEKSYDDGKKAWEKDHGR